MNKFSDKTIEELGYYVYSLTDPRNNKIFYCMKVWRGECKINCVGL